MTSLLILLDDPGLPSSHVSALQYVDLLRGSGYSVEVAAVTSSEVAARRLRAERIARRLRVPSAARPFVSRMQDAHEKDLIARAAQSDLVYLVKAPRLDLMRRLRELPRPRILFHVSDAFWLPFLRRHGWAEADEMFRLAHGVTTTNEYTAARIRPFQPKVFVVPDCPQVEDFDTRRSAVRRKESPVMVGWIGTPLTAGSLYRIWEPLERLARQRDDWTLRIVGSGHESMAALPRFESVRWSARPGYDQAEMIDEVLRMHIGLFPLFQTEDALARGALKALIYMSGGAASISEDCGDNRELVREGVNGFLARSDDEWYEKLRLLITDPDLRAKIAAAALETVRTGYSRAAVFEHLRAAMESTVRR